MQVLHIIQFTVDKLDKLYKFHKLYSIHEYSLIYCLHKRWH